MCQNRFDLVSALTCLRDRVLRGAPRLVHGTHRNKYLLFADACHEEGGAGLGSLGGILYGPTGMVVAWFGEWLELQDLEVINPDFKKTLIYELEASASHAACVQLCKGIRRADIICFTDNEAVLSNLITGKPDVHLVSRMLDEVYEWEGSNDCNLWFDMPILRMTLQEGSMMAFPQHVCRLHVDMCSEWKRLLQNRF